MRSIAHLSDIHFGRTDPVVVEDLRAKLYELSPHLLVVSGDLTQRAKRVQFQEAKAFLDCFAMPKIVVPGNHDVPLYNVFERFVRPLRKYDEFFEMEPECWFVDDGLAVAGVNTARSLVVKGGRINKEQVARVRARFGNIDDRVLKIVVSHHPFDLPDGFDDDDIVGRAAKFMPEFAGCGADVFLAGHLHVSAITTSARRYHLDSGRAALVIQAGTATSTRGRGERNSFNLLEFESPRLTIRRLEHIKGDGFVLANEETFEQTPDAGWSKI